MFAFSVGLKYFNAEFVGNQVLLCFLMSHLLRITFWFNVTATRCYKAWLIHLISYAFTIFVAPAFKIEVGTLEMTLAIILTF